MSIEVEQQTQDDQASSSSSSSSYTLKKWLVKHRFSFIDRTYLTNQGNPCPLFELPEYGLMAKEMDNVLLLTGFDTRRIFRVKQECLSMKLIQIYLSQQYKSPFFLNVDRFLLLHTSKSLSFSFLQQKASHSLLDCWNLTTPLRQWMSFVLQTIVAIFDLHIVLRLYHNDFYIRNMLVSDLPSSSDKTSGSTGTMIHVKNRYNQDIRIPIVGSKVIKIIDFGFSSAPSYFQIPDSKSFHLEQNKDLTLLAQHSHHVLSFPIPDHTRDFLSALSSFIIHLSKLHYQKQHSQTQPSFEMLVLQTWYSISLNNLTLSKSKWYRLQWKLLSLVSNYYFSENDNKQTNNPSNNNDKKTNNNNNNKKSNNETSNNNDKKTNYDKKSKNETSNDKKTSNDKSNDNNNNKNETSNDKKTSNMIEIDLTQKPSLNELKTYSHFWTCYVGFPELVPPSFPSCKKI